MQTRLSEMSATRSDERNYSDRCQTVSDRWGCEIEFEVFVFKNRVKD